MSQMRVVRTEDDSMIVQCLCEQWQVECPLELDVQLVVEALIEHKAECPQLASLRLTRRAHQE